MLQAICDVSSFWFICTHSATDFHLLFHFFSKIDCCLLPLVICLFMFFFFFANTFVLSNLIDSIIIIFSTLVIFLSIHQIHFVVIWPWCWIVIANIILIFTVVIFPPSYPFAIAVITSNLVIAFINRQYISNMILPASVCLIIIPIGIMRIIVVVCLKIIHQSCVC